MDYQLLIIGGGASGLAAAVTAAQHGVQRIAVLERLPRVGKKILATGNGRCNLSHAGITAADYRGSAPTEQILAEFGDAKAFFEALGLYTRTDSTGRMYPYSMTANAVLDALRLAAAQYGIEELCGQEVTVLRKKGALWHVRTAQTEYTAPFVIFAAGGHAAPKLGTDGSAWALLDALGIPLVPARPILCPVRSEPRLLYPLKGLRIKGEISLYEGERCLHTEAGEIQFTDAALSGICVFNLSERIDPAYPEKYVLLLNCIPEGTADDLLSCLYTMQGTRSGASCEDMLTGLLPKAMARHVLKMQHIRADLPCLSLDTHAMQMLSAGIRGVPFPVKGLGDFTQAQATAGGVRGDALDAHLQVKAHPGLYITGEAVDVHADCGGYHLHWCWASGAAAAKQIAAER